MNSASIRWAMLVCLIVGTSGSARADAADESNRLHSIARELSALRSLVDTSAQISAEHSERLRFDYQYLLDALDYLVDSTKTHVRLRTHQRSEPWDLNRHVRLQKQKPVVVVAASPQRHATGSTEQQRLSDIAREIELVRAVVGRASVSAAQNRSRISFDYAYMLDVLAYLDYAVRAHVSLQHSQSRTQWDRNRRIRLNPDVKVVIE